MQSWQQALWAYCPNNIYTVISARLVLFGHDFSLNESSLSSAASVSPIPPLPTGLVIGRVPRGPRRPRPHSVAISASSSSSCGQLQYSPIRRKLQREKPREFFRVAESAVKCAVFKFLKMFCYWVFEICCHRANPVNSILFSKTGIAVNYFLELNCQWQIW